MYFYTIFVLLCSVFFMIDLISLRSLLTVIPFPLFVYSPGLIIHISLQPSCFFNLLNASSNLRYSGSSCPLIWNVSGSMVQCSFPIFSKYDLMLRNSAFLLLMWKWFSRWLANCVYSLFSFSLHDPRHFINLLESSYVQTMLAFSISAFSTDVHHQRYFIIPLTNIELFPFPTKYL